MKYDFIYSEAVALISTRKKDGTKFFSRDSLCIVVSENDKIFSAFNDSEYADGKLITGYSERVVLKKMAEVGETKVKALITMNCIDMKAVIPDPECIAEICALDHFNYNAIIVSPDNKYIKITDLSDYKEGGDNSAIEYSSLNTGAKPPKNKQEKLIPELNFDQPAENSEKSETIYLFPKPGTADSSNSEIQSDDHIKEDQMNYNNQGNVNAPAQQEQQVPELIYKLEYVVSQYSPEQYMQGGVNQSGMPNGMNQQYMQNGMNQQQMPNGMNQQQMQNGMSRQYSNHNGNSVYSTMSSTYMNGRVTKTMGGSYNAAAGKNQQFIPDGSFSDENVDILTDKLNSLLDD